MAGVKVGRRLKLRNLRGLRGLRGPRKLRGLRGAAGRVRRLFKAAPEEAAAPAAQGLSPDVLERVKRFAQMLGRGLRGQ